MRDKVLVVQKISDFYVSGLDNAYIKIKGTITDENGESRNIRFKMIFEKAIGDVPGIEPEVLIPEEYRCKWGNNISSEIETLYKLYQDGAISKDQYESQKRKLLEHER